MIYAKIIDGQLNYAPKMLVIGDSKVWNAPGEMYLAQGWKPLVYTAAPEAPTGYHYEASWDEQETEIVQVWTLVEDPDDIDEYEAWNIIFGEGDA